ncbi:hypothetical protein, partial [uncultured Bilophila sp.]
RERERERERETAPTNHELKEETVLKKGKGVGRVAGIKGGSTRESRWFSGMLWDTRKMKYLLHMNCN